MTVSSELNRKEYAGNGVTTAFATSPVIFFDASDLEVYDVLGSTGAATLKTITTDYTVSGGSGAVGTVTMLTAPVSGHTLVIVRKVPLTQTDDFVQNDPSDAEVVEDRFDRTTMMAQQLAEEQDRTIKLSTAETGSAALTELPFDRASKFLAFDASKNPIASSGTTGTVPVSTFMETVLDDTTAALARATLDVPSNSEAILDTLIAAKGDLIVGTANDTPAILSIGAAGTVPMSRAAATSGLAYAAVLNKAIYGLTYSNGTDATNDIDIAAGGCMDATGAYWITLSALTKQSDAAWAVGTAAGGLDTGAVGNSDYYIWAIARSDTGVTDVLFSLSSTAPTMPTNYDFKRLIGWFKRVGGTIVAFTTYEIDGGGLELAWTVPTLDVNLSNTLTTSRRTDAVKVPLNFSTIAILNVHSGDASSGYSINICCPDQTDAAPSTTLAPLNNLRSNAAGTASGMFYVRTSSTGTVASRADLATVDSYLMSTVGFRWARRN